jgi:hypothetical protein
MPADAFDEPAMYTAKVEEISPTERKETNAEGIVIYYDAVVDEKGKIFYTSDGKKVWTRRPEAPIPTLGSFALIHSKWLGPIRR